MIKSQRIFVTNATNGLSAQIVLYVLKFQITYGPYRAKKVNDIIVELLTLSKMFHTSKISVWSNQETMRAQQSLRHLRTSIKRTSAGNSAAQSLGVVQAWACAQIIICGLEFSWCSLATSHCTRASNNQTNMFERQCSGQPWVPTGGSRIQSSGHQPATTKWMTGNNHADTCGR